MPKKALGFLVKMLESKYIESSKEASQPTDGPHAYIISLARRVAKPGVQSREADSSSALTQLVRPEVKKVDKKKESGQKTSVARFQFTERAKGADTQPSSFDVILLKEGLGNWKDGFYYSKDALKGAADTRVFEGEKIYADHPSESDEVNRPERSVRDILGYYTGVNYQESKEGQGMLVGKVIIPSAPAYDWARSLMSEAIDYSELYDNKDFIGVSINASGDANPMSIDDLIKQGVPDPCLLKLQEAKAKGLVDAKYVTIIGDAKSCDLVTEAGAGGRIVSES